MEGYTYTSVSEDDNYDNYFLWNLLDHEDVIDDDGEDCPTKLQRVFDNMPLRDKEFTQKGAPSHPKKTYQTRSPTSVLHNSVDLEVKSTATSPELLVPEETQTKHQTKHQTQTRTKHRTRTQRKHPRPASKWHLLTPTMPHNTKNDSAKKKKKRDLIEIPDKTENKEVGPNQPVSGKKCSHCQIAETPQWRVGPEGPSTLCNACGVRYRTGRLYPEYRPAASPTFIPMFHSNSHRRVMKMRNKSIQEPCVTEMNPATFSMPTELHMMHDSQVGSDIFTEALVPENHHPLAMLRLPEVLPVSSYLSDLWNQG